MEKFWMDTIVFFTGFTLLSYILIVLNIPFLIIPIFIFGIYKQFKKLPKKIGHIKPLTLLVFVIGIIFQMAVIAPSGIENKDGDILFWSSHGHDGAWHVALMEEIKKGYPFQNPTFAGEKLTNYHFFSDIIPAMVSKYTPISDWDLYFRIFPFIYSLFLGISAYYLTKLITKNHKSSLWAVVFTYFAGSFGYLIGKGESVFWATQPQSSSGNPPQIISDFLLLSAIYFVIKFIKEKKNRKKYFLSSFLILGTISSFKIYAGVVILMSVGLFSLVRIIKDKKWDLFWLTFLSGLMALVLYLPNSSGSTTSFLIFEPWWYIRTMIVEPSRLNLLDWELRRQTYIYEHNWKRVIWLEGMGFLIFFFGNLGVRFLGLWEAAKSHPLFKIIISLSLIFPLLFLQKGVASNTSQFLQYFVLLFGILSGITVSKISSPASWVLYPVFFLLMIPTQVGLLRDFYNRPAFTKIPAEEIRALEFIKNNTTSDTIILTPPYDKDLNTKEITPPIWDWFDTAYVSAISSRRTYFDDYEQVDIMGYEYEEREKVKETIFTSKNGNDIKNAIIKTNANIIYIPKKLKPIIKMSDLNYKIIFKNSSVEVWRTN